MILESDPFSVEMPTIEEALDAATAFADLINCDVSNITCMRSVDTPTVVKAGDDAFVVINQPLFNQLILIIIISSSSSSSSSSE